MSTYTPGPWQIDDGDSEAIGIFDSTGEAICYLSENPHGGSGLREEDEANAKLISCAPEMADILRELVDTSGGRYQYSPTTWTYSELIAKAEAVLKKEGVI
jgi:hypothetical protein